MTRLVNAKHRRRRLEQRRSTRAWSPTRWSSIVTRKGNPKNIKTCDDLVKPGVEVITPNPFTSGGARWNIMAAYGAQSDRGQDRGRRAELPARRCSTNVPVQDDSGRAVAADLHRRQGRRPHLLRERGDLRPAERPGRSTTSCPTPRILIENPAAVTKQQRAPEARPRRSSTSSARTGQKIFAENGYRPVSKTAGTAGQDFPTPSGLFTIQDLGGWADVTTKFFDPEKGIVTDRARARGLGREVGRSTATTATGAGAGPPPWGPAGASARRRARRRPLHGKGGAIGLGLVDDST